MASETGRAQTIDSNICGVRIINKAKNDVSRITREGKPKKVKVLYMKTEWRRDKSRVVRDTRNLVWITGDHPRRLNTTWWPIVKKYREGKLKRTPGGEWNRTWNPMFTSRQSTLRCDVVLFVERSGELFYMARLSTEGTKPKGNRVWRARLSQLP